MCGCGRKRTEVVTSAQLTDDAQQRADLLAQIEAQTIREAEAYARSAANAVRNASSE